MRNMSNNSQWLLSYFTLNRSDLFTGLEEIAESQEKTSFEKKIQTKFKRKNAFNNKYISQERSRILEKEIEKRRQKNTGYQKEKIGILNQFLHSNYRIKNILDNYKWPERNLYSKN